MAHTLTRLIGLPFMSLIWICSVIGLALASSLVAHYGGSTPWPGSLAAWTKASVALFSTTTLLSMISLAALAFGMASIFSLLIQAPIWFLMFAWSLTQAIGLDYANDANSCRLFFPRRARCSTSRTLEAFAWLTAFFILLYLVSSLVAGLLDRRRDRTGTTASTGAGAGLAGAGAAAGAGVASTPGAGAPGTVPVAHGPETVPPMHTEHIQMGQPAGAPRATV